MYNVMIFSYRLFYWALLGLIRVAREKSYKTAHRVFTVNIYLSDAPCPITSVQ